MKFALELLLKVMPKSLKIVLSDGAALPSVLSMKVDPPMPVGPSQPSRPLENVVVIAAFSPVARASCAAIANATTRDLVRGLMAFPSVD